VLDLRDAYEARFRSIIERGCEQGAFRVDSARLASYAIVAMGIGVAVLFRDGPISEDGVARAYCEYALRLAGWADAFTRAGQTTDALARWPLRPERARSNRGSIRSSCHLVASCCSHLFPPGAVGRNYGSS
jgi:hypothetical protein